MCVLVSTDTDRQTERERARASRAAGGDTGAGKVTPDMKMAKLTIITPDVEVAKLAVKQHPP